MVRRTAFVEQQWGQRLILDGICRVPVTKLGRLVKDGKIKSIEEIYLFSLPVKEYQIIDILLPKLKGVF